MVGLASIPAGILDARVDEAMIARFASAAAGLDSLASPGRPLLAQSPALFFSFPPRDGRFTMPSFAVVSVAESQPTVVKIVGTSASSR
jgi:hypothetical protein